MLREGEDLDNIRSKSSRVAPVLGRTEVSEENTCRICMEPGTKEKELISPCKCSGSVKYIHEDCLKIWLISQESDIDEGRCELCKTEFLMEFKIGKQCSPSESLKNGWSPALYLPVLTIVMAVLFLIIYLLAEKYIKIDESGEKKGYVVALMITCGASGGVLFVLIVSTLKEICFIARLEEWRIFSQSFNEESSESKEEIDHTFLQEKSFSSVFIVPEHLVVSGVKVKTPDFRPNLNQISQRGRVVGYASRAVSPGPSCSISVPLRMYTDPYENHG